MDFEPTTDQDAIPTGPQVFTKMIAIEDDCDEEDDNYLRISEIKGEPQLGTASSIWESSIVFSKYFQHNLNSIKTKFSCKERNKKLKIQELGSGTGVLGQYLASLGCDVILSDLERVSITITRANLEDEINTNLLRENGGSAKIMALDWTWPIEKLKKTFDENLKDECIDIIVASDVIFNSLAVETFTDFVKNLRQCFIDNNTGCPVVYMAHKKRSEYIDDKLIDIFHKKCEFYGQEIEQTSQSMNMDYLNHSIAIFYFDDKLD